MVIDYCFTHLELCLATAIHNFKCVKNTWVGTDVVLMLGRRCERSCYCFFCVAVHKSSTTSVVERRDDAVRCGSCSSEANQWIGNYSEVTQAEIETSFARSYYDPEDKQSSKTWSPRPDDVRTDPSHANYTRVKVRFHNIKLK